MFLFPRCILLVVVMSCFCGTHWPTSKILILYQISIVVESEWKKVGRGRWIEAFEELGRQHQDGMGWDGTDPPQKTEKYFSVRFKRRASASVVA